MAEPGTPPSDLHRRVAIAGFDEMQDRTGELRDHWRYVMGSLRMLGRAALIERQSEVAHVLRQDGAIHHENAPGGVTAAGGLDLIPLLVSSDDWATVEAGLVQRAELLDLILEDLYGAQDLIRRGVIPVEVVHRSPGYLRPVVGSTPLGEHRLVHYGADLARRDDGRFVVLADHTRVPAGLGDTLEHRLVLSRVLPSLFRDAHVHRLAHFFRGVRRAVDALNPVERGGPGIVILTPGPEAPDYFEHSYLASYLGYPLVEPGDLTVRRGRVWLRSLAGLQQVDVVLRWVSDELSDPLELLPGTGTGVPGLVEAARRGSVAIANPIGAAVVESPGLLPFLPAVGEHLLGSPLLLDSVDTWWCGNPADLQLVLDEIGSMVLQPIDQVSPHITSGAMLSGTALDDTVRQVRSDPQRWVAQRLPAGGWTPTLVGDQIESLPYSMRTHLVAREGSYVALPGGSARVPAPGIPIRVPHPSQPSSTTMAKDLWVLASEPERPGTSLLSEAGTDAGGGPLVLPTPPTIAGSLPSRVAENLYWFGRYSERAEQSIRWARAVMTRIIDATDQGEVTGTWLPDLLDALRRSTGAGQPGGSAPEASMIDDPTTDVLDALYPPDGRLGVVGAVRSLSSAALTVRELLSDDTWQVVDAMQDEVDLMLRHRPTTAAAAQQGLSHLLTSLFALNGLAAESTVRDPVWLFLDAGQRLERAQLLVSTSRATLVAVRDIDSDALVYESVLIANDSLITYRRRYRSRLRIGSVLELLIGDPSNPRSLIYQVERLAEHAANLPAEDESGTPTEVAQRVAALADLLHDADLASIAYRVDSSRRSGLDELLGRTSGALTALSEALGRHFLHVEPPRTLGTLTRTGTPSP
ncbi:MAG: circularly permuted type 2 ATP-grasp protein [Acidimicrobiales bacterium]